MHSAFIWFFLSMKGRIGPQEFRLGLLGLVLVDMLVVRIARKLIYTGPQYYTVKPPVDWPIGSAVLIISLWPLVAILVKRLHDLNISGWWALTILASPFVVHALGIPSWIPYLFLAATLSAYPGRPGDNRFGPAPLTRMRV